MREERYSMNEVVSHINEASSLSQISQKSSHFWNFSLWRSKLIFRREWWLKRSIGFLSIIRRGDGVQIYVHIQIFRNKKWFILVTILPVRILYAGLNTQCLVTCIELSLTTQFSVNNVRNDMCRHRAYRMSKAWPRPQGAHIPAKGRITWDETLQAQSGSMRAGRPIDGAGSSGRESQRQERASGISTQASRGQSCGPPHQGRSFVCCRQWSHWRIISKIGGREKKWAPLTAWRRPGYLTGQGSTCQEWEPEGDSPFPTHDPEQSPRGTEAAHRGGGGADLGKEIW